MNFAVVRCSTILLAKFLNTFVEVDVIVITMLVSRGYDNDEAGMADRRSASARVSDRAVALNEKLAFLYTK